MPGTARPGAIERTLKPQLPEIRESRIEIPAPQGFGTPRGAENFHFTLKHVAVDGASALSGDEIAATYASLIGHDVTLAQIYDEAHRITDLYAREGYALSFALVPAQEVDPATGSVRIDIVEGYITEVRYDGDTADLPQIVKDYGDRITRSHPLKTAVLERYLLLMNDVPGYKVSGLFDRIPDSPKGATRLIVKVAHQPVELSGEIDNRGSKAFGPWQAGVTAQLNSLLGQGESVMLHGIRALNANQLSAGVAHASMPLGTDGLTLSLTTTYSDGHPGSAALSALHFASNGWTSTLQLNYPLLRGREESLWVWGGVSGKWLKSALAATPNSRDHLYELLAGATWNERDSDGLTSADATLTQGLDAFGATTSSPLRSRAAGSGAFTSLAATITRLQSLSQTSIGEFDLYGLLSGQAASRGLLASEQCGFGGATFGRAFDANEIVGDHCLMGSVELRLTPDVDKSFAGGVLDSAQFFLLADGGKVWNTGTLGFGDKRTEDGASLGVGLRLRLLDHVNGSVEYDQPVGHRVALENNRSGRVFVQLSVAN